MVSTRRSEYKSKPAKDDGETDSNNTSATSNELNENQMETDELEFNSKKLCVVLKNINDGKTVNEIPTTDEKSSEIANIVPDISNILAEINKTNNEKTDEKKSDGKKRNKKQKNKKKKQNEIRGLPKSGRFWKTTKEKFSKVKSSIHHGEFKQKMAFRNDMKHIKELSMSIKEDRKKQNEHKKMRREQNAKIKIENERKSEIVQVIKNPARIKRMKKKQLRLIEKRDLSKVKVV